MRDITHAIKPETLQKDASTKVSANLAIWFLRKNFKSYFIRYSFVKVRPSPLWPNSTHRDNELNQPESTPSEDNSTQV